MSVDFSHPTKHLLHLEHFVTPALGSSFATSLAQQAETFSQIYGATESELPGVSAVIRTRNDQDRIESLLQDFEDQKYTETQVIVVDTESTDWTTDIAKSFGALVINITQDEFSYPRALNLGFERADNPVVFSTVGHAALSTDVSMAAGANHFKDDKVGGVFVPPLPANWATPIERAASLGNAESIYKPKQLKKAAMGVMGATNAMFSKEAWEELNHFDEQFAAGGEDTEFARVMLAAGYDIIRDPLVAVHHIHGLGPMNYLKQWRHWMRILSGPQEINLDEILARRPDLRAKFD